MNDVSSIPKGWCCTSLEKVASWGSGGTPSRNVERYFQGIIPWVKTGELERKYIRETEEHISEEALNNSSAKIFPKGSVGIAMYGATIGKLSIWGIDASTNQACAVGIPTVAINNEFLYYYLLSERQSLIKAGKGGAQPNLSQGIIKEWPINLPPLNEQNRIVAKIEELFSELDKGIENLKTARAQLKVYRQALLKHAFEGKLTAQWRAENQDKLETADALLKRIQQERAQRYQQQLAEWTNKSPSVPLLQRGKPTSAATSSPLSSSLAHPPLKKGGRGDLKPKAPKPLPPLTKEELAELPELPEGWGWELIGRFTEVKGGKRLPAGANYCENSTPHPYIRVVDFENFGVRVSGLKYISFETQKQISQYTISSEDTYISIAGTIGRVGTIPQLLEGANLTENAAKICGNLVVNNKYLSYWLHSAGGSSQLVEKTISTTQPKLALFRIEKVVVPVCSKEEQVLIVNHLESRLSEVDQLELTLTASLQQAEALRQSILKKAFAGLLVPQDPHDEPASKLLARIKAERATVVKNETVAAKARKRSIGGKLSRVEISRLASLNKEP